MGELVLILGPNGSGKSRFAERFLDARAGGARFYSATMLPQTEENARRIAKHRAQRAGLGFQTLERPWFVSGAPVTPGSAVLLEDVSNLLANAIFAPAGDARNAEAPPESADAPAAPRTARIAAEIVGEIGADVAGEIPANAVGERAADVAGEIPANAVGKRAADAAGEIPANAARECAADAAGEIAAEVAADIAALRARCALLVCVTISGLTPAGITDAGTVAYIAALNALNRRLLEDADAAAQMRGGVPHAVKGVWNEIV